MQRLSFIVVSCLATLIISCGGSLSNRKPGQDGITDASGKEWVKGKDYTVVKRFRIEDKMGFGEPVVAYSILLPEDWKTEGGINWRVGHSCMNESVANRMTATSPDGSIVIDFFPVRSWEWQDNEMMRQSAMSNAQMGFKTCDIMPPMNAGEYLKTEFSREIGNPQVVSIEPNEALGRTMEEQARKNKSFMQSAGVNTVDYKPSAITAKLKYPGGNSGIALCAVNQTVFYMQDFLNGGMMGSYVCSADQNVVIRFPDAKEEEARKILSMVMSSIRINPGWQNAVSQVFRNVAKVEQNENAKRAAIWRKTQDEIAEIHKNTWEFQQQSQDRIAEETGRMLRGVEQWSDPFTGTHTDLSAGYSEAWSKGDGTYILSNDPLFDPAVALQEDWKRMEKGGSKGVVSGQ